MAQVEGDPFLTHEGHCVPVPPVVPTGIEVEATVQLRVVVILNALAFKDGGSRDATAIARIALRRIDWMVVVFVIHK